MAAGNEVLRAGIAALIGQRPGFAVSETSVDPVALVKEAQARQPDVLLVDVEMAGSLREILRARRSSGGTVTNVAVVALSADDPPDLDVLRELVQCGVEGIVTANDQATQLSGAMQAVRRGRRWLSPTIGSYLLDALRRSGPASSSRPGAAPGMDLTPRERAVLALVADGLTVGQIAKRLHRSESAIKYHLSNMSARYQASNRAHLVYLAVRAGELPVD
ncbi:response regulator transcription factor [Micromonospora sp. NPDC007271]|uniref:response regulator transcription factor n=1 Tax=Micromonospora sp. NPDC007271 TaxID=3154587 RepID=UPI0033F6D758